MVCLCDSNGIPDCTSREYRLLDPKFPGETFNISAVAIGQFNGKCPAIVMSDKDVQIGYLEEWQGMQWIPKEGIQQPNIQHLHQRIPVSDITGSNH